jgi:Skp family chaperone for outer membrane proteins
MKQREWTPNMPQLTPNELATKARVTGQPYDKIAQTFVEIPADIQGQMAAMQKQIVDMMSNLQAMQAENTALKEAGKSKAAELKTKAEAVDRALEATRVSKVKPAGVKGQSSLPAPEK